MATATINGVVFEMSIAELIEFANANKATEVFEKVTEPVKRVSRPKPPTNSEVVKDEPNNVSAELETLHCETCDTDFQRPRSRGRKPTQCPTCKNGSNSESEDESGSEDNSEHKGGKRQYPKGNKSNFVPRNPLIDPATEDDLAEIQAELDGNKGKWEFIRQGLKNLDGSKVDFAIVYSSKKNCHYYKINDGENWATYGSTDDYLASLGVKRVTQKAKLAAEVNLWQKNGKSRIYVNPSDKNAAGGGWYVIGR